MGLCNGARAIFLSCLPRCLEVLVISGKCKGERTFIPRIPMTSQQGALPFQLVRRQFPCKLAWAMTINKAQGQSLLKTGLWLEEPVFAHGQIYVATSRASGFKSIRIILKTSDQQGFREKDMDNEEGYYTDNIVYKDMLSLSCANNNDAIQQSSKEKDEVQQSSKDKDEVSMDPTVAHALLEKHHCAKDDSHNHEPSAYPIYFEKQQEVCCGIHALNNAIGYQLLSSMDMSQA